MKHAMKDALTFIAQCNGWHSFAPDVRQPILRLAAQGLVDVIEYQQKSVTGQFRITAAGLLTLSDPFQSARPCWMREAR